MTIKNITSQKRKSNLELLSLYHCLKTVTKYALIFNAPAVCSGWNNSLSTLLIIQVFIQKHRLSWHAKTSLITSSEPDTPFLHPSPYFNHVLRPMWLGFFRPSVIVYEGLFTTMIIYLWVYDSDLDLPIHFMTFLWLMIIILPNQLHQLLVTYYPCSMI